MLEAEADFKGHTPEEHLFKLEKIFRRYSRCEETILPPLEHATAMKERLYILFDRYKNRPEALKRVSYRLWPVTDLIQQLRGAASTSDWGVEDKRIVQDAFLKIREIKKPKSSPGEFSLERA